jgi:hypothetical protein
MLRRGIFVRFDSYGLAVAPNHGILAKTALPLQRFGDSGAQGIKRALIVGG